MKKREIFRRNDTCFFVARDLISKLLLLGRKNQETDGDDDKVIELAGEF